MRKAVSPVIATLLLILIAVATAVLVYVWVTGYASSVTSTGTPELQEKIKIDAVDYEGGTELTVYIRNIGDVSVEIDAVYVVEATTNNVVGSKTDVGQTLSAGDVASVDVTLDDQLTEGVTYIVKAVTTNGVEAAVSFSYSP